MMTNSTLAAQSPKMVYAKPSGIPPTNPNDSIVKEILVEADKWSVFKYCIGIEKSVFEQPAPARRTGRENPQWV
jgi:hypothetical protein